MFPAFYIFNALLYTLQVASSLQEGRNIFGFKLKIIFVCSGSAFGVDPLNPESIYQVFCEGKVEDQRSDDEETQDDENDDTIMSSTIVDKN